MLSIVDSFLLGWRAYRDRMLNSDGTHPLYDLYDDPTRDEILAIVDTAYPKVNEPLKEHPIG